MQTLSSIENDGEDIGILFSWNITVDWHWGCLMRLVTVFKSRKKEIMGIFNLVQSNPTQNAIQSNPILSIRSQSHCNNFEYFRNCKFVHTATEKPDRYRQRKILRTHQEYGLGVGSRIKILPNLLIILNTVS